MGGKSGYMSNYDWIKAIITLVVLILGIDFMVNRTLSSFINLSKVEKENEDGKESWNFNDGWKLIYW